MNSAEGRQCSQLNCLEITKMFMDQDQIPETPDIDIDTKYYIKCDECKKDLCNGTLALNSFFGLIIIVIFLSKLIM